MQAMQEQLLAYGMHAFAILLFTFFAINNFSHFIEVCCFTLTFD